MLAFSGEAAGTDRRKCQRRPWAQAGLRRLCPAAGSWVRPWAGRRPEHPWAPLPRARELQGPCRHREPPSAPPTTVQPGARGCVSCTEPHGATIWGAVGARGSPAAGHPPSWAAGPSSLPSQPAALATREPPACHQREPCSHTGPSPLPAAPLQPCLQPDLSKRRHSHSGPSQAPGIRIRTWDEAGTAPSHQTPTSPGAPRLGPSQQRVGPTPLGEARSGSSELCAAPPSLRRPLPGGLQQDTRHPPPKPGQTRPRAPALGTPAARRGVEGGPEGPQQCRSPRRWRLLGLGLPSLDVPAGRGTGQWQPCQPHSASPRGAGLQVPLGCSPHRQEADRQEAGWPPPAPPPGGREARAPGRRQRTPRGRAGPGSLHAARRLLPGVRASASTHGGTF